VQGSSLADYVTALEAALLGYVVKYGLSDQARAVFAARGQSSPQDQALSDHEVAPSEETSS
jgi:hypothetical protein